MIRPVSTDRGDSGVLPADWTLVHEHILPTRDATYVSPAALGLAPSTSGLLDGGAKAGLYGHQYSALEHFLAGKDVCLTTGTASGKTLAFQLAGIHRLATQPEGRILALYPQKALASEQERRWSAALAACGHPPEAVARIDGGVHTSERPRLLKSARVLVATPDVVHAWLLSNLGEPSVRHFVRATSLIVLDEVHTYTGVVGSNAAYLFRRLEHACRSLGGSPSYFAASATLRNPASHLATLLARPVTLVEADRDTSPRHEVRIRMVRPPAGADFLTSVSRLLQHVLMASQSRFLAFVDSRKQSEHLASILGRSADQAANRTTVPGQETDADSGEGDFFDRSVLPYRAGYEERDRQEIEGRLASGQLRGVISTSALELGIDLPHLDLGILMGVPFSSTSLTQRIGRIGRAAPGQVLVVHGGSVLDEAVFSQPDSLLNRPPAEGALYLENRRIQYIHALCLARVGGEHDQALPAAGDLPIESPVAWPAGFLELCQAERTGQLPLSDKDLWSLKADGGDQPQLTFPLREVEKQFKVVLAQGPYQEERGKLSYPQLLREAYPGAIYYYLTTPLRVTYVDMSSRVVKVRREKRYTTKPILWPSAVYPNLQHGGVYAGQVLGELRVVECALQISETVAGFKERRGGQGETDYHYPLEHPDGLRYRAPRFNRNYFTSGVLLHHPVLNSSIVKTETIGRFVYEALLMIAPFDRGDLNHAADFLRLEADQLQKGSRFVAIYDQTYGSLRLSGRLIQAGVLPVVLERAMELLGAEAEDSYRAGNLRALRELRAACDLPPQPMAFHPTVVLAGGGQEKRTTVIQPGSRGLSTRYGNEDFLVEKVFLHPTMGLAYRGRHASSPAGHAETIPVTDILPVPGESGLAFYDPDTGELSPS